MCNPNDQPSTPRMDSHQQLQSAGPKTFSSSKGSCKRQKRSDGGRPHHLDKPKTF